MDLSIMLSSNVLFSFYLAEQFVTPIPFLSYIIQDIIVELDSGECDLC